MRPTQAINPKGWQNKVGAISIAVGVHAILLFILAIVVILPEVRPGPQIEASIVAPEKQSRQQRPVEVPQSILQPRSPASATSPIQTQSIAAISLAKPEISEAPVGLGEVIMSEASFGGQLSQGSVSFFGMSAEGQHFAFVLDHSLSMNPARMDRMREELIKSLKTLPENALFSIISFARDPWDAFQRTRQEKGDIMPQVGWHQANTEGVKRAIKALLEQEKGFGTNWQKALAAAYAMDPEPDVIFLLSDGQAKGTGKDWSDPRTGKSGRGLHAYFEHLGKEYPTTKIQGVLIGAPEARADMEMAAALTRGTMRMVPDQPTSKSKKKSKKR